MPNAPARPPSIPPEAVFSPDVDNWEVGTRSADGRRRGISTFYRLDGTLYLRANFEGGVQDGPFTMFHPNGQVAREGTYARGELDGDLVAHTSEKATNLPLRPCCVPEGAITLRATYRQGQVVREAFFDADERELSDKGVPLPPRPASVPAQAIFDDLSWRWIVRQEKNPVCHVDRHFTADGVLSEELEYTSGSKSARRLFDTRGELFEWNGFDADGRLHGPFLKRVPEGQDSPHADQRIRAERGQFDHGHPVGRVELLDQHDAVVRTLDFGRAWSADAEATLSHALTDDAADAGTLWTAAHALRDDGRLREALCVAARAAVRPSSPASAAMLAEFVKEATYQLTPALTQERGVALANASDATFVSAMDELLLGTDPASAYRTLSAVIEHAPRLALELIDAALLLAPHGLLFHFTRGLIRLELGDKTGVLTDAQLVTESDEGAQFLQASAHVMFPDFTFWPARETLPPVSEDAPEMSLGQSLEAVRHQIQVYATRHARLREALQKIQGRPRDDMWLPPDCAALLPDGPVNLRKETIEMRDDNEEGVEEITVVELDERIDQVPATTASSVLRALRANWAALSWLCWAAGLDEVALPERLVARPDFGAAVAMSLERRFRARDLTNTGGMLARSQGIAGFIWEGFEIDALPGSLATILADEYQEIRAMFLWSMWEQNVSPFQSDLRPD